MHSRTIFADFQKLQAVVIVDWNGRKQGVKHQISLNFNKSIVSITSEVI
jgi:hypothetical protein